MGRGLVVFGASALVARGTRAIPPSWRIVVSWGGLRGGLSTVLALSLPSSFPNRDVLITTTFGVVLLSILIQGLTMAPLLRRLGVIRPRTARVAYDRRRGELNALRAAISELDRMLGAGQADRAGLDTLRSEYETRLNRVQGELDGLRTEYTDLHAEDLRRARRHLLMVEKAQTLEAARQGLLSREAQDRLLAHIDGRLLQLEDVETA